MEQPLLSVIIPVFNGGKFIHEALASILSQPCEDLEVILVNDGSTDTTQQICETAAQNDKRVKLINKINTGVSDSRNKGMAAANGKYVAFLDADDIWAKDVYNNHLQQELASAPDMVGFNFHHADMQLHPYKSSDFSDKVFEKGGDWAVDYFWQFFWCFFYRREFLEQNRITFDLKLKYFEDELFRSKALYLARKIVCKSDFLVYYRLNRWSTTGLNRSFRLYEMQRLEVYQAYKDFFFEQYRKQGETPCVKNAKTVQNYIRGLKGLPKIGYGYKKMVRLYESDSSFQQLKKGDYKFPLDEESRMILKSYLDNPRVFYFKNRVNGIIHSFLFHAKRFLMMRRTNT